MTRLTVSADRLDFHQTGAGPPALLSAAFAVLMIILAVILLIDGQAIGAVAGLVLALAAAIFAAIRAATSETLSLDRPGDRIALRRKSPFGDATDTLTLSATDLDYWSFDGAEAEAMGARHDLILFDSRTSPATLRLSDRRGRAATQGLHDRIAEWWQAETDPDPSALPD